MKRYNILWNLCVLFILTVLPNFGYSQLLNKIKQSVQNGVERGLLNTLEDKVEEETKDLIEKETSSDEIDTTQSIEISEEENTNPPQSANKLFESLFGNNTSVTLQDNYKLEIISTVVIEDLTAKDPNPIRMELGFGEQCFYSASELQKGGMLYDYSNEAMIMTNMETKTYTILPSNLSSLTDISSKSQKKDDEEVSFTKTGKSKSILGYHCEEYVSQDSDGNGIYWITEDLSIPNLEFYKKIAKSTANDSRLNAAVNGYLMEMEYFDKKGKKSTHMLVEAIDTKGRIIDISSYKQTSILDSK